MADQRRVAFESGVNAILRTWPALKLACDNDCDGPVVAENKINNMREEIVDYFTKFGHNIDIEDMVDFYSTFFIDVFGLEVDDGSIQEMSALSCALYGQIRNDNDTLYRELMSKSMQTIRVQVEDKTNDTVDDSETMIEFDEDEDLLDEEEIMLEDSAMQVEEEPKQPTTIIDEDGLEWTVVPKKKKNRNNNK